MSDGEIGAGEAHASAMRALARIAAQKVLFNDRNDRPVDPRDRLFASQYIAECDRLLAATPPLLQDALENAGHAAEGTNIDPFQGIVEVMQNADDRQAREVRVMLRSVGPRLQMLLVHDGLPVEYEHVIAMLLPFVSTKQNDADQRGRFGIGLKTLRRIARDIEIHGWPYHFGSGEGVSIVERAPEPGVEAFYDPAKDTLLVLDLEEDFPRQAFERWMEDWTEDGLVFLEHLRVFRHRRPEGQDLVRETKATAWRAAPCDGARVERLDQRTVRAGSRRYLVYRALLPVPADQRRFHKQTGASTAISVATCGREEAGGLFIGFRTRIPTKLHMLVDAQFDPTSSREGVQDNRWNKWLISQMGEALGQIAAAAFLTDPRRAWRFAPIGGEGVTSTGWPADEVAYALGQARERIAELARFGPAKDAAMPELVFEAPELSQLITTDDLTALAPGRLALPLEDRDATGRWREVLAAIGVSREIAPTEILQALDEAAFAARPVDWWVQAAVQLTASCPPAFVHGAPLWLREDLVRVASQAANLTDRKIVLSDALPELALRHDLFDRLHSAFDSPAGAAAVEWLKAHAAFTENISARDELLSFAQAYSQAPLKLPDEELRHIRDRLDPFTGNTAAELGARVGRALLLEAAEGTAKGARSWRSPAQLYLSKAIDKDNPNWPNAAAGLSSIHWVVPAYEDRLRTGLGKQRIRPDGARSRGARAFLTLLGCEVGPRILSGREPDRRSRQRQLSMSKTKASSIPEDWLSPDLERVLRAILDTHRPKKERRERALALLKCLSRDWSRRLRDVAAVKGFHQARVHGWERGIHTAHWLDRLQDIAWIPVGRERFRVPGEAAIKTSETQSLYRTEDFVSGLGPDEIDLDFAQALGLTAKVRAGDLIVMLEAMRDGETNFDAGRARLAYQHLARITPRSPWASEIGDLTVSDLRARFSRGAGLVLVVNGERTAEWRRPSQVRRGKQVLPKSEQYVIDEACRALWTLLKIEETTLDDCCDYLKSHAAEYGPGDEDGVLIQVYRYMSGLLAKGQQSAPPAVRHAPLACLQDWRARRPILLVENAGLRAQIAAARPHLFFWRPPCDTRSISTLVEALSVTQLSPHVRPLPDARAIEGGEDHAVTFQAAVEHLSDTLGRANEAKRSALLVPWEQLKTLKLFVYDDAVPVEVSDPALGPALRTTLRAHLQRAPFELHATADALGQRDEVGALIATLFDASVEYPFDGEWALAWQAAERNQAAALKFAVDDAAHAAKVTAKAAQVAANASGAVKLKASSSTAGNKAQPVPPARELKTVQPGVSAVSIVEGQKPGPLKGPIRPNLKHRKKPSSPDANNRVANAAYTNGQLEDFGWDVVVHVLQRSDGPDLEDFRRRHNVGADGAFDWEEFVELKAAGRSMQTSVALTASEYAKALQCGNDYILALVYQCEKGSQTRVKLIFDPARRASVRETEAVRLSGLDFAPGILVELGDDGSVITAKD